MAALRKDKFLTDYRRERNIEKIKLSSFYHEDLQRGKLLTIDTNGESCSPLPWDEYELKFLVEFDTTQGCQKYNIYYGMQLQLTSNDPEKQKQEIRDIDKFWDSFYISDNDSSLSNVPLLQGDVIGEHNEYWPIWTMLGHNQNIDEAIILLKELREKAKQHLKAMQHTSNK